MILGTESSASLVGGLVVAVAVGGGEFGPAAFAPAPAPENLELRLLNQELLREREGLPLLGEEPVLSLEAVAPRVKPGLGGIGLGWAFAVLSASLLLMSWVSVTGL